MMNVEVVIGFLMIIIIGSLSLIGAFMISIREKTLDKILFILVAFATGTILASALFDLIPESLHHLEELNAEGAAIAKVFYLFLSFLALFCFLLLNDLFIGFLGMLTKKTIN